MSMPILASVAAATTMSGNGIVPTSPVAVMGTISILLAFVTAAWCVAAGIAGNARKNARLVRSSVYGLYLFTALIGLSAALIIYAFVTHDFSIKYVAATSDTSMPLAYKITSFWGGLDGSLLFWSVMLAMFSAVAIAVNHKRHRDMIGYVVATIMVVQVFFIALLVFSKNPFATSLTPAPIDGKGLNPLLQNYWMVIHPPSLYTGFVAATIPFAFAIGALASGRLDDLWISSVRVWVLICFFFLSFGLVLGGRWAYEVLGWGGYWAWDPVENAGFLPWFTATAFLHSAIIQEQRGMLKGWNLLLCILTFFLTIFGTFMTRSGVVQSVHAFGEDNVLALQFIVFMIVILVVSLGLLLYRSNRLGRTNEFESFISREFAFLMNNWILLGCAFFVLFATMFPTISQAIDGERVSVGKEFFNRWMTPLALVLLLLAGIAPLLAWRRTTRERLKNQFLVPSTLAALTVIIIAIAVPAARVKTAIFAKTFSLPMPLVTYGVIAFVFGSVLQEFWRGVAVRMRQTGSDPLSSLIGLVLAKRRKYGGYVVHLGIAVLFFGFTGKAYEGMIDRTIPNPTQVSATHEPQRGEPGSFEYFGYSFSYENLQESYDDNKTAVTATVSLWKNGKKLATMFPASWDYHRGEQPLNQVSIHTRIDGEDVYLVLTGYKAETGEANFRIYINPMVNFVWGGAMLVLIGTLICLIPGGLVQRVSPKPTSRRGRAADVVAVLVVFFGPLLAAGGIARADTVSGSNVKPQVIAQAGGGAEHIDPTNTGGGGMGAADGTSYAQTYRPDSPTATALMKELVCMCGGCQRESLYDCKCGYAADKRREVLAMLQGEDLKSDAGQKKAYDKVIAAFVREFGGEQVLSTPSSKLTWALPAVAVIGGLGLLLVVGRRWVGRGQRHFVTSDGKNVEVKAEDQAYADRLDDELSEVD